MTFIIGQRWVSQTEPQLGLGIIKEVLGRQVTICFPAVEEERTYAASSAPLSRVSYRSGESFITLDDQTMTVIAAHEEDGLLIYSVETAEGEIVDIDELDLSCFIKLTTPQQRLLNGQIDKNFAFQLRVETLFNKANLQESGVRGLIGARTDHIPHQVYIAHEVAQRFAPRVLLADEVGLGKTIEAGLIIHHQLQNSRARRILIVVPETLIHQWLVEMLRRFNLPFSLFDQNRYESLLPEEGDEKQRDNPFESAQYILCSLNFLTQNLSAHRDAVEAGWDLMVVDEAHHLHWSQAKASPEYCCIEALSSSSKGLLLLTATPEQVGIESHFARLRLLDPARFYNLDAFKTEEQGYEALNTLVVDIEQKNSLKLDAYWLEKLMPWLGNQYGLETGQVLKAEPLIRDLLDRHGTGRILFRNTRDGVSGFPDRHINYYPLALPDIYVAQNLFPETQVEESVWVREDPRVSWLLNHLKFLRPEKVLVICAHAETALALEDFFRLRNGVRSAVFHEGLSLIERDRAAAYFSDEIEGAQVLICSEIGSEGRNFQFSHHLVMFDLPTNPDLLEQRIGRLDRIGQTKTVEIHVPCLIGSAQESLFRWYQEGANLFEKSCSAGYSIYEHFEVRLEQAYCLKMDENAFKQLLEDTRLLTAETWSSLEKGRNRLLERNACRKEVAQELILDIEKLEEPKLVCSFMEKVFNQYGVQHEDHSEGAWVIRPGDHMRDGYFPCLKEEGMTITFNRKQALSREDMVFLSWEHPMVTESMEMILDSEFGNVAFAQISLKGLKPGTLMLEGFYTPMTQAPKSLQLGRFLSASPVRVLIEAQGKNLSAVLDHLRLNHLCQKIKRNTAQAVLKQVRPEIEALTQMAEREAKSTVFEKIEQAKNKMRLALNSEIERLQALQRVNPMIRTEEIYYLEAQRDASEACLQQASLHLDALRLIINA